MAATPADIAIVGVAGCYPGAADARAFWRNILDKVDAVGPADADWTGPYLDPDSSDSDRIYTNQGGFLRDLATFNPADFGIMPSSIDGGEPDHYLALKLAQDALTDAGYQRGGYEPERAGVILGRGTYINRGYTTVMQHGMAIDQTLEALKTARPDLTAADLQELRRSLRAQLPAFNAEMAPGVIPNVTTGIIANRLDLMGPNYIIDAACASSLIAVELAVRELHSGRCDMVLAGGVQAHTAPQLFMVFCQLNALSRGRIRPFSTEGGGTLLGEGAGMLVLKRLADAEAAGDRIYAVIKGLGTSSDGRARGLLAPRPEGEVLALRRAYEAAGVDPASVGLIEAHGTGIPMGDKTEVESLAEVFGAREGHAPRVALGSVKSNISHCIPAAGSASLIKSALALHHKVLPPMLCDEVDPKLQIERTPFYINTETRPWVHGGSAPRRAGVNAFGFGGINAHAVLEEYRPSRAEAQISVPPQWEMPSEELLLFAAASHDALLQAVDATVARLRAEPGVSLAGVARALARRAGAATDAEAGRHRLAIVAADVDAALGQLGKARERLADGKGSFHTRNGQMCAGDQPPAGKLAFVFPGEGAQYAGMLGDLVVAWPQVREWLDFLDRIFAEGRDYRPSDAMMPPPTGLSAEQREALDSALYDMDLGSESVFASSQAFAGLLAGLGIRADMMVGHSTGENSALVASGVIRPEDREALAGMAFELNRVYRRVEGEGKVRHGSLLTVGALGQDERNAAIAELADRLWLAMDNCPNQAVLFGDKADIEQAHAALTAAGGICSELPFGRAYHTPLFAPVAEAFVDYYASIDVTAPETPLYSCASAAPFPTEPDAIRALACGQWTAPVRFVDTVRQLYADGARTFLEVGPSANLTGFVGDILREHKEAVALSCNSRRQPDNRHFLSTLARLWSLGHTLRPEALFAHRGLPEVDLDAAPEAAKPGPTLNLSMPSLRITADMLPAMPEPEPAPAPAPAPAAPDTTAAAAPASSAGTPAPAASPESPPAAPEDPRTAWIQSHFALMQQFLENQQRVLAVATGGAPAGAAAPATAALQPATPAAADHPDPFPLLGEVVEESAEQLVIRRVCTMAKDPYLADHTLGGQPSLHDGTLLPLPIVPFTFSMETLAEAAKRMAGEGARFVGIDNARGSRWLALEGESLALRIVVTPGTEAGTYSGRIFAEIPGARMDGGMLVFEGIVRFADALPAAPEPIAWTSGEGRAAVNNPDGELYDRGMFHGPRLQGVRRLLRWSDEAIEAEMEVLPAHDYFTHTTRPEFQFDAALLDAAGQLAGFWISEKFGWKHNVFPFRVGCFRVYASTPPAGTRLTGRATMRMSSESTLEAEVDIILPDGTLLARATGWEDREFEVPDRLYQYRLKPTERFLSSPAVMPLPEGWFARHVPAFPEHFLDGGGGIWKHGLAHMAMNETERAQFYALPASGKRREEWVLGRFAAKEAARDWIAAHYGLQLANADIEVTTDEAGAPSLRCPLVGDRPLPSISLAHSHGHAVACAVPPGLTVGIDYQGLERVRFEDVVSGAIAPAEQALLPSASPQRDAAVVAFWAAKEATAKARRTGLEGTPLDWHVIGATLDERGNGTVRVEHHGQQTAVLVVRVSDTAIMAVAADAAQPAAASLLGAVAPASGETAATLH